MIGFRDLARVFGMIGVTSFGGPAAQIALMHRMLVDERKWLSESEYLGALSFCMLLPGPEAMQLATYAGWRLRGIPGGLIAGVLFVAPGALAIFALASLYVAFGDLPAVSAAFLGVKACVVVIVIEALLRVSKRALKGWPHRIIALAAFVGIFFLAVPFPAVIIAAALAGAVWLTAGTETGAEAPVPRHGGLPVILVLGLGLWSVPLLAAWAAGSPFLLDLGLFFSKLAVVTFGGAYAVLAWMTQEVVRDFGWVTTQEMMDALGLAETTPGPLILVTQFVGFLAGHTQGGWGLAVTAGLTVLWVTFVPCFLWIFAFAPYVDWIATRTRLAAALQGVTAAVVGVIGNLALWFALTLFFGPHGSVSFGPLSLPAPDLAGFDPVAAGIAAVCAFLLLVRHMALLPVLGLSALLGLAVHVIG
jgi:chromate transporter